ncbi:MAG: ABC transporter ATP-binding protein [Candidatus Marinimicrobia bacterium]|nr:ABC transporter ATP-binding protein [Candidatus Neomarinimicrobiota bacterium]
MSKRADAAPTAALGALLVEALRVTYRLPGGRGGTVPALRGISLTLPPNRILGLLGPNGAGKTTLIQTLLGFVKPSAGTVQIFGAAAGSRAARARLGYLPELPLFYPYLTGRELLDFNGRLFGLAPRVRRARAADLLERVGLTPAADRRLAAYSRGMLQRIGLAQALINNPDLVILDEPTSGLDPLGRLEVRRLISDLKTDGKTILFSSHELSEVELVCDQVAILSAGRLLRHGNPTDWQQPGESLEQLFVREIQADRAGNAA